MGSKVIAAGRNDNTDPIGGINWCRKCRL